MYMYTRPTDLVLRHFIYEINANKRGFWKANITAKYKYMDRSTFFSFSFGYKMQQVMF